MDQLQQMYQQLILDHAKHPVGRGLLAEPAAEHFGQSHQVNPACGDEITLQVSLNPDKTVETVTWEGEGCSISQASASVMSEMVAGLPVSQVQHLDELFHELMNSRGKGLTESAEDELGDATAFTGVSQYPARIKCALLGWVALKDSILRAGGID
jgi:nitrogen fixation protein NifU and related proteins